MTLDDRARAAAVTVSEGLDTLVVPESTVVVRKARRRRVGVGVLAVVAAATAITAFQTVTGGRASRKIEVRGPLPQSLPPGSVTDAVWSMIPKATSGIGVGSSLHALVADGTTLLLAGEKPAQGRSEVTMWWSDDGFHWTEAQHPTEHDRVTAVAVHGNTALAVGAPGGASAFVWRSDDRGRHWQEIARGSLFGAPVTGSRPGAFVSGLLWYRGWWIAYGGAADGYEGIWVSHDGTQWRLALDSQSSGSVDSVVETSDGALAAFGARVHFRGVSTVEIGWFTNDPQSWGPALPITTPDRYHLSSVGPGGTLAVGQDIDKGHVATPLLRSADGGHTWSRDTTFTSMFPTAWAWTATRGAGIDVVAGTTTQTNQPAVWLSSGGNTWAIGPQRSPPPNLPTTSVPQVPPTGALTLVATIGDRIVFMGSAPELDRYYTFDVAKMSAPPSIAPTTTPTTASATTFRVQQAVFTSADAGWITTADPTTAVFRTTDAGAHWTDVTPRGLTGIVTGLFALDDAHAWITSTVPTEQRGQCTTTISRTTDGGASWRPTAVPGCNSQHFSFLGASGGWDEDSVGAAAGQEEVIILHTTDGGLHWQQMSRTASIDGQNPGTPRALTTYCGKAGIGFVNATTGFATGACNIGVFFESTHDAGRTWQPVNLPLPHGITITDVHDARYTPLISQPTFVGSFGAALAVNNLKYPGSYLYVTNDAGRTWSTVTLPVKTATAIDIVDATHWWTTDGTTLLSTDNGGTTWRSIHPNTRLVEPTSLHFSTDRSGWVVSNGRVMRTDDAGYTWRTTQPTR